MNDTKEYLNLIIESQRVAKLFVFSLERYLIANNLHCNAMQAISLYLIKNNGGINVPQNDIQQCLRHISSNGSYTFSALVENGYIISTTGTKHSKGGSSDKRRAFLTLTDKGNLLYDKISDYAKSQIVEMETEMVWDKQDSKNYMNDLDSLMTFLKGE